MMSYISLNILKYLILHFLKYCIHIMLYLVLIITVSERAWRVQICCLFLLILMHAELIFDLIMGLSRF